MKYDTIVVVTAKDFKRLQNNYFRLVKFIADGTIFFVGSEEVGWLTAQAGLGPRVSYINENDVLPFDTVHELMKRRLNRPDLIRGITGWYYQQFLKMQFCMQSEQEYYLVWDGDTIPCRTLEMFQPESGKPYMDLKTEYHEEYFITLKKLLPGMRKNIKKSYIGEHMLMNCGIMKALIRDIEANEAIPGRLFYEKVIGCIPVEKLTSNSFSEFETYGTYTAHRFPGVYQLRSWHSFRYGGQFFDPDTIKDSDYEWLGKDFDAISFEKNSHVREDNRNLFDNKYYQERLTAKQMLLAAQEAYDEGYIEVWDD